MKAGRILVALMLTAGVAGAIITGAAIYSRLLYLSLILGIGSWLWTYQVGNRLFLRRRARNQRANVGDIFEENYEVENNSWLIAPWVEIKNRSLIPFASGSRILTFLSSHQKQTFIARTWLTRRGGFHLGPTSITTGDPFGLFRMSKNIKSHQTLVVLPVLVEINSFLFPPGLMAGGQVIRRKSPDVTPHAAGVRDYMHGDAMKRIHWPSSIRRNHLMVKEFDQDPQAEIWLYLDSQEGVHHQKSYKNDEIPIESMLFGRRPKYQLPPSSLEYSICIVASLVHYFIGQRRAVGYVSEGKTLTVHAAERSRRQEAKILETLAFVEATGTLSLGALVAAQASQLPQGSSAILVTPSTRSDILFAVEDLKRRYLNPLVILLDGASFGGGSGEENLVQALHERLVPVCTIPCGADLSQMLSGLTSGFISQDMRSWQNLASSQ
jgi:uncharacterized protein (DUF58 family)